MELVIADANNKDLFITEDYELDCSFGDDENTLEITLSPEVAPPAEGYAYIDGTEYGGTIDSTKAETTRGGERVITCTGRSWQGFLAAKRLVPDSASSHITVSGKFCDVVSTLLQRCTLTGIFKADPESVQTVSSFTFDRFCDLYNGLRKMCRANGLKLTLGRHDGFVWIGAKPAEIIGNQIDNDLLDFDITQNHRVCNHLVCAGEGEGTERAVVHLYADKDGNISQTQSIFGLDEIVGLYEYNSAEQDKLIEDGTKKLKDYQSNGNVELKTHDDLIADVGDIVTARDNDTNMLLSAEVIKKIVKVQSGVVSYEYEVGQAASYASTTYEGTGGGGGGGGGHSYFAGDGLQLNNYVFSADVTESDLANVEQIANEAHTEASGAASAAAESAQSAASAASSAEAAQNAASAAETAANVAKQTAEAARTTANEAKSAASKAETSASTAEANAADALSAANKAKSDAASANTKAIEAKATADDALQKAEEAAAGELTDKQVFLYAHPVGSIYYTTKKQNLSAIYGGTWKSLDCLGGYAYERTA